MILKERNKEIFKNWVSDLPIRIEAWIVTLNKELKDKLDFSPRSLKDLGEYLVINFDFESFRKLENKKVPDAIVSYLGETLRINLKGSYWSIDPEDEENLFYNLPVIKYDTQTPISPHSLVTRTLKMNNPQFLYKFYLKRRSM